jgi:hypothetical protein
MATVFLTITRVSPRVTLFIKIRVCLMRAIVTVMIIATTTRASARRIMIGFLIYLGLIGSTTATKVILSATSIGLASRMGGSRSTLVLDATSWGNESGWSNRILID